jgi:acetyl esterase/lipase
MGRPPPLDPELAAGLAVIHGGLPWRSLTPNLIDELRQAQAAVRSVDDEALRRQGAYTVQDLAVAGPPGDPDIAVLLCTPTSRTVPTPAIYYIHDGGMVAGDRRSGIDYALDLAEPHGMVVVSVEYRLPPEHPHPAPVEDCYAGLQWTAMHAEQLGIDPERIVIFGNSAGGGLAAAVALLARDRGGPELYGQLLGYPMLDDRNDTVSSLQMKGLVPWDHVSNQTGWEALLGDRRGRPDVSPYAAAARAADLSGLPRTFIDVGSAETFRDEAVTYASRVWQAGGQAELHVWPGGFHAFDFTMPQAALSQAMTRARKDWLRRLLA